MAIILYAITKNKYFCRKETIDKKVDDLSWMRISTDRKLFRELTTLFTNQPIIVGYKTLRVMPKLEHRHIIPISTCSDRGISLKQALEKYPEAIVIGGASVLKSAMQFNHREHINSILTVRLPISIPSEDIENYIIDPLDPFKESNVIKLSNRFYIHTDNYEQPTIALEIWRPTNSWSK